MYETAGRVDIASQYGRDLYANALDFYVKNNGICANDLSNIRYVYEVPSLVLFNSNKNTLKTILWLMPHV